MSETNWKQNSLQFPRLLAEIRAIGLSDEQYDELKDLMDLNQNEIDDIFERAEVEWEIIKEQIFAGLI